MNSWAGRALAVHTVVTKQKRAKTHPELMELFGIIQLRSEAKFADIYELRIGKGYK